MVTAKHTRGCVTAILAITNSVIAGQLLEQFAPPARLFSLTNVRLTDPELLKIRELDHKYLLSLDSDRLLRNHRENHGIKTGIPELGGHEACTGPHAQARGHYLGHYLSASAMMVASTGDQKLKGKADAIMAELAKLQQTNGYLSAQPESLFADMDKGRIGGIGWYVQHKLMAGLLDMYVLAGNQQALDVARKLGDWVDARTKAIDRAAMQSVLNSEFGGMGEALANLAAVTGEKKYLAAAQRFDHDVILQPAIAGEDQLTGKHGNTTIPKFTAAAREYELTGNESYRKGVEYFWRQVALHRSYVTGGNSCNEGFRTPPDVLSPTLGPGTQESCNTYNILKLTEHVFSWNPDATVGDYYERALYNHILATPHPETGMPLYFLGLMPSQWKVHFVAHKSFWCCTGTGLENFAKLQRGIYYHGKDQLWVNLFIASEVDWKEKGVTIRQQTTFPNEPGTTLLINAERPVSFKLSIRIPYWAEGAALMVNGKAVQSPKAGTIATIDREWKKDEKVEVKLPMRLHLWPMSDNPNIVAVMYGPLVLAGELGEVPKDMIQREEHDPFRLYSEKPYPDADKLALVGLTDKLEDCIQPVPGKPLTFKTTGVGQPQDVVLSPFYRLFEKRYNVYWKLKSRP